MADIEDSPDIPDSRRDLAARIVRQQAEGKLCEYCGKRIGHFRFCTIFQPSPATVALALPISGPTEEALTTWASAKLTKHDVNSLAKDAAAIDLTLGTEVSPEVRAECEAEMEAARKRGWRLLKSQKKSKAPKESEPDVEVGPDDRV
jgi:hypothetical protein